MAADHQAGVESRSSRHFRVPAWHTDRHALDRTQPQADGDLA
jgi:hypothetical protein